MRFFASIFLLLLGLFFGGCETRTTIVNNVPEREANEIYTLLASRGIDAVKTIAPTTAVGGAGVQTWDISVSPNYVTESIAILNQAGLPRVKGTSLLDLFGESGLVPSDLQDRIRYQEGLSEQLANTIRKMDGVLDANVQITFPAEDQKDKTLTASVYIKHRGILDNPNSILVTKVKRLVSSSLPGLTIDNVTVVSDRALYADLSSSKGGTFEEPKDFVSIWGVDVTKDSATRFRFIFYVFFFLFFILLSALGWTLWKVFPLIEQRGGFKNFFGPEQVTKEEVVEVKEEEL